MAALKVAELTDTRCGNRIFPYYLGVQWRLPIVRVSRALTEILELP